MTGPLPQFLVIGAMKAGTTSLHHYLQAHPGLFLPRTKELNFFRDEAHFARGEAWYRKQFAEATPEQVCGEISPDYTKHPHHSGAPERIAAMLPDVRLVYLVRHPVERMRSMFLHQLVAGRETRPIDVALLEDPEYLQVSQYARQLDRYLRHVDRDRVLICSSEQLGEDPASVLGEVHRFLGVGTPEPAAVAAGTSTQWYRGEDRRRRGRVARFMAERPLARRVFDALPTGLRSGLRRASSSPVEGDVRALSDGAREEIVRRLRPDVERFRAYAPEIVDGWGLLPR